MHGIQENENIPLKFDVMLFQVTVTCCKFISLKTASTSVAETSRYKFYLVRYPFGASIRRGRTHIQKRKNSILNTKFHFPTWTCQIIQTKMGDNTNLFTLSESAINAIKKPELVHKIIALKGKVIVDSDISNLCNQISKLNDSISQLNSTNEKNKK